jgi:UDPglucose 6-dehydrogenase
MIITFIGHGYVGLVTAAVFADLGNTVWVIGHTAEKIENLKKGIIPIYEPGLEEVVKRNVDAGRLLFTLDYDKAIPASEVVFIAVGTPPKENGEADLSIVYDVAHKVGEHVDDYTVMTVKSTVPVGTNRKVKAIVDGLKKDTAYIDIASVPEFLREGQALTDTFHPDRVVIGTETDKARETLVELHRPLIESEGSFGQMFTTSIETAEMIKYASNAFLATKISFANAIAQLSEKVGADGPDVLKAMGMDKRIGTSFLNPGAGYGGSCFPKDVNALIHIAKENEYAFDLLQEVEEINQEAKEAMVTKARNIVGGTLAGKTVAVLGLSFKPDTDDIRDAPARHIIDALTAEGAVIRTFDPIAMENFKKGMKSTDITYANDAYDAVKDAEVMILVTEWNEFKELDLAKVKTLMKTPNLIDGRNIYDPHKTRDLGFTYVGVGR